MLEEKDSILETIIKIGTTFKEIKKPPKQKRESTTEKTNKSETSNWRHGARDEKGLGRFVGAFTGGFSAGYFNTVGSKEGFTPAPFKSSRKDRNKEQIKQGISDFLDEDDRMEGIQGKTFFLQTDEQEKDDGSLLYGFKRIVEPHTSIGEKMIQRMKQEKRSKNQNLLTSKNNNFNSSNNNNSINKKQYGPQLDFEELKMLREEDYSIEIKNFETPEKIHHIKNDLFGLGYEQYSDAPEFSMEKRRKESNNKNSNKMKMGYFSSDNDDSDDVFGGNDDLSNYDISLNLNEEEEWQSERNQKNKSRKTQGADQSTNPFVLSTNKKDGKLAEIDSSISFKKPSNFQIKRHIFPFPASIAEDFNKLLKSAPSNPKERAFTLGEIDPLKNISQENPILPSLDNPTPTAFTSPQSNPLLPFPDNPHKQQRYREFLLSQSENNKSKFQFKDENERVDFEYASNVWRTVPQAMSERFVSASKPGEMENKEKIEKSIQDEVFKMYGKNTRKEEDWVPSKLLCKRMNIKEPHPGQMHSKSETSLSAFPLLDEFFSRIPGNNFSFNKFDAENDEDDGLDNQEENDDLVQSAPTIVKPSLEVFKSIFDDDDDEDEEEEENQNNKNEKEIKKTEEILKKLPNNNLLPPKNTSLPTTPSSSSSSSQINDFFNSIFSAPQPSSSISSKSGYLAQNIEDDDSHLWTEKTSDNNEKKRKKTKKIKKSKKTKKSKKSKKSKKDK